MNQKWNKLTDVEKQSYLNSEIANLNKIVGNSNNTYLVIEDINNTNTGGSYNKLYDVIFINSKYYRCNDFFAVYDTLLHEGVGHGYQNYFYENKEEVLKKYPSINPI